jgi:hypothetical protein
MLSACSTLGPQEPGVPPIVVKDHYITREIPDEHLTIPEQAPSIDVKNATQKDVAIWVTNTEKRMKDLETKLIKIKQIQDENLAKDEQANEEKK